jgi:hypothetical protein
MQKVLEFAWNKQKRLSQTSDFLSHILVKIINGVWDKKNTDRKDQETEQVFSKRRSRIRLIALIRIRIPDTDPEGLKGKGKRS